MRFKQLNTDPETKWFKRFFRSRHTVRTLIFIVIGALAGFMYFYASEGIHMNEITPGDVLKSVLVGGFFGFFITNSPCARNKC